MTEKSDGDDGWERRERGEHRDGEGERGTQGWRGREGNTGMERNFLRFYLYIRTDSMSSALLFAFLFLLCPMFSSTIVQYPIASVDWPRLVRSRSLNEIILFFDIDRLPLPLARSMYIFIYCE